MESTYAEQLSKLAKQYTPKASHLLRTQILATMAQLEDILRKIMDMDAGIVDHTIILPERKDAPAETEEVVRTSKKATIGTYNFPQYGGQLSFPAMPHNMPSAFYVKEVDGVANIYFSPIPGVRIRVPSVVVKNGAIDMIKAKSVKCKFETLERCMAMRNIQCSFAHVGERYSIVSYPLRCLSNPTVGNASTLFRDAPILSKREVYLLITRGLVDLMVGVVWMLKNPCDAVIDDIDVVF